MSTDTSKNMVQKGVPEGAAVQASDTHAHHDELLTEELLDFLALASHQLRTPLSLIKGYIAMLVDGTFGPVTKEQKVVLEKVFNTSERMIRLVNNFLDLPRIHLGMMPFSRDPVSLTQVLAHSVAEARMQADMKKLPITWSAPAEPCTIAGDRENLLQAFSNLLDNAIKYTSQGRVGIALEHIDGVYRVTISDTGRGMPKEDLPKLFSKFMRGDDMRELYREGRGMGLYISKQIIEGHGGTIRAASDGLGTGSTFIIEIPEATA